MQEEERYLVAMENEVQESSPSLAFHIARYRLDRTRFFSIHQSQFAALAKVAGFTGSTKPGVAIDPTLRRTAPHSPRCPSPMDAAPPENQQPRQPYAMSVAEDLDAAEASFGLGNVTPKFSLDKAGCASSDEDSEEEGAGVLRDEEYLEARLKVLEISAL